MVKDKKTKSLSLKLNKLQTILWIEVDVFIADKSYKLIKLYD